MERCGITSRQPSGRRALAGFCLCVCLSSGLAVSASWDFARIIRLAEQHYGNLGASRERLERWAQLLANGASLSEGEQLRAVNDFFNQALMFSDDASIWQQIDYWATPLEALFKGAGDCEDFAIAKYLTLRQLGMPGEKLRITYVKALDLDQAHMVLAWYATPGSEPLVLDNLIAEIRPASQRPDLLPVYAFNAEGLWLTGTGDARRIDARRSGDSKHLSRWQDLLNKMRHEGFARTEGKEAP